MTTSLSLKLIDDRNRLFWDTVSQSYNTTVQLYEGHHYNTQLSGTSLRMQVPSENVSKELFTHELLHLYLRKKKILITDFLVQQLKREPLLKWSLTENLMEQVGHFLEHVQMLPIYLQAEFERDKFIENFDRPVCHHLHIQQLFAGMRKAVPSPAIIDLYIHQFFAMKAHPDDEADYSGKLIDLESINDDLFAVLSKFWEQWISFDINRYDPADYTYKSFAAAFIHELGAWTVRNMYCRERVA